MRTVETLRCPRCRQTWLPRVTHGKPIRCPRCGKKLANTPRTGETS